MNRFVRYQLPVYLWLVLIFTLSALPGDSPPDIFPIPHLDKIAHLIEYGILGFLLFRAFSRAENLRWRCHSLCWTLVTGIGWALSDEFHQWFVPGRSADIVDVAVDVVGVGVGITIYHIDLFGRRQFEIKTKNGPKVGKD